MIDHPGDQKQDTPTNRPGLHLQVTATDTKLGTYRVRHDGRLGLHARFKFLDGSIIAAPHARQRTNRCMRTAFWVKQGESTTVQCQGNRTSVPMFGISYDAEKSLD